MSSTHPFRIGLGYDLHRLVEERPLILGGLSFDHPTGLSGHSDADVVLHAIMDALLGAAGMPDIGDLFPDDDPSFKGADSARLTREVIGRIRENGWVPINIDCVIHAEQPKIGPRKVEMSHSIAEILDVPAESVCVKATTNEGLGPVGRRKAIACTAVAMLARG